jgi:hypothetical protein
MVMAVSQPDTGDAHNRPCREYRGQQRQGHPARRALANALAQREDRCDQAGTSHWPV